MFENISSQFSQLFRNLSGKSSISEKNIEEAVESIKNALLEADVNLRVVRRFINRTIEEAKGIAVIKNVNPGQQFIKIVHDSLVHLLGDTNSDLLQKGPDTVSTIFLVGLQGSGKTTTAAKLALRLKKSGRKVLLVAADLQRPAAIEQLKILGKQIEVEVFSEMGKDVLRTVQNAEKYASRNFFNTVIVDTAGRLQIDDNLMTELQELKRVSGPTETIFVADAMTGQNAVEIAQVFEEKVGISSVILTKFDSDTRGGAAISLKSIVGKPIKFIGVGEKLEQLDVFHPERIASRILGMGDIVSLVEKAQETFDEEKMVQLQKKMASNNFDLQDWLDQFRQIKRMGSMQSVMSMLPGISEQMKDQISDESALKKEEAIILSMTKKERENYLILSPSRRKRISSGSGTTIYDVNQMLKKFEKTRLMMKKVAKNKNLQAQMLGKIG